MAMHLGGRGGLNAEINVTPMIDLLLVLIIIFIVVTPLKPVGLQTALPEPAPSGSPANEPSRDIVVSIYKDRTLAINGSPVEPEHLDHRLREIFARSGARVLFVSADPDLEFRDVAGVIDAARGAGVFQIGLMTAYQQ